LDNREYFELIAAVTLKYQRFAKSTILVGLTNNTPSAICLEVKASASTRGGVSIITKSYY